MTNRRLLIPVVILLALTAAVVALLPSLAGAQSDPTVDAAVNQAFTQTAEAQGMAGTEAFQATVDAAIQQTIAAQQAQPTAAPQSTVAPAPVITPASAPDIAEGGVFSGHTDAVSAVDINPEGTLLASASYDGTVRVWDIDTGENVLTLAHEAPVLDVAFNPVASEIIATGENGQILRWNVNTGEPLPVTEEFTIISDTVAEPLVSEGAVIVGFGRDGDQFATFDFNGTLGVWSYPEVRASFYGVRYNFALVNFSEEDPIFAYTTPQQPTTVEIARLDEFTEVTQRYEIDAGYAEPVAFSRDGTRLMVLGDDGSNRVFDLTTEQEMFSFAYAGYGLSAFSPDATLIADGSADGNIFMLSGETGDRLATLGGHSAAITEFAFSGDLMASASEDNTVRLWRIGEVDGQQVAGAQSAEAPPAPQDDDDDDDDNGPTPLPDGFPPVTEADVQVAEQVFEGGRMFWVQPVNQIWVMVVDDEGRGQWLIYEDTFVEGEDVEEDPAINPPAGLYEPVRGFGKLWRENPEVRDTLGWGVTPEFGYVSLYRYVPGGEIVNGEYVPGPGYHVLFSLNSEAFHFDEATGMWHLGEG